MSSGLRIVILVSFANLAGAQIAAVRLARGLRDRGHDPKVMYLYEQSPVNSPDHPYEVLLPTAKPGASGYLRIWYEIARVLRREKPDLVLTFLPLASVLGQATAFVTGVRRRVVSHRMPVNTAGPLLRRLDTLWAWLGVYTRVVAVSESVRATCRHYPAWLLKRTVVVHNGLRDWRSSALTRDQARRRFGIPDDTFALVAVGRLVHQKNYPFMLKIMQRVDNVVLLIGGGGELHPQLEDLIATLGIADKVRLLGEVGRTDIPDLLAAADVFLQTSTYEGQSNSILEALHAGIPIVAHDIPEQREALVDPDGSVAGILVPLEDTDAWGAAIEKVRNDPALAKSLRETAARRAKLFRYETMIDGFEDALVSD